MKKETIATIGFFDGVHIGHHYLLSQLKTLAKRENIETSLITFPVHPRKVLNKEFQPKLLNTFEEKITKLEATGIDNCYVLDFTKELAEMTACDFMNNILKTELNIKGLLIGYDHKFGKDRAHSYNDYVKFGEQCGIKIYPAKELDLEDLHVSSTVIRNLIEEGEIVKANKLLSYNYFIKGKVIEGNKIGRTIGVPTANLQINSSLKVIPQKGVYAVCVTLNSERYKGMAYIGDRPTVSQQGENRIEVNIFDFNKDIYGEDITIEFVDFVRNDTQFENLDKLKQQLSTDKEYIINQVFK
ncbi:riboflavin kinase/FMN adenylyltransferase [Dysgonomonadaceae bacterium PH5-43]|nr:riboflavin kinase/FMN adenylyltransferase [Dysgonomonadaceae bacterium PH5-43]